MGHAELGMIERRLQKVERRFYMAAVGWGLSVMLLVWLGPLAPRAVSQPAVVRSRAVEITDASGRLRITLDAVSNKPSVWLYDAAGHRRLGFTLSAYGTPEVVLKDAAGGTRIVMSVGLERAAELKLSDARGRPRIGLWIGYSGEPGLWLFDDLTRPRIGLKVLAGGQPKVWLFEHPSGRILFSAP